MKKLLATLVILAILMMTGCGKHTRSGKCIEQGYKGAIYSEALGSRCSNLVKTTDGCISFADRDGSPGSMCGSYSIHTSTR